MSILLQRCNRLYTQIQQEPFRHTTIHASQHKQQIMLRLSVATDFTTCEDHTINGT